MMMVMMIMITTVLFSLCPPLHCTVVQPFWSCKYIHEPWSNVSWFLLDYKEVLLTMHVLSIQGANISGNFLDFYDKYDVYSVCIVWGDNDKNISRHCHFHHHYFFVFALIIFTHACMRMNFFSSFTFHFLFF